MNDTVSLAHGTYKLGFNKYSPVVGAKDIIEIKAMYNAYTKKVESSSDKSGYKYFGFTQMHISYRDSNGNIKQTILNKLKNGNEMRNADWEILFEEIFAESDKQIGRDIKFFHIPFKSIFIRTDNELNEIIGDCDHINDCRQFDDQCDVCIHNRKLKDRDQYDDMYFPKDDNKALEIGWKI